MKIGMQSMQVQASNVKDLLKRMEFELEDMTYSELKQNVIFVNGKNITEQKMYRTKLKDGDEVLFMSPVSGG